MSAIAEKVFEIVKTLPDEQAAEVLAFVEFLRAKAIQGHGVDEAGAAPDKVNGVETQRF